MKNKAAINIAVISVLVVYLSAYFLVRDLLVPEPYMNLYRTERDRGNTNVAKWLYFNNNRASDQFLYFFFYPAIRVDVWMKWAMVNFGNVDRSEVFIPRLD